HGFSAPTGFIGLRAAPADGATTTTASTAAAVAQRRAPFMSPPSPFRMPLPFATSERESSPLTGGCQCHTTSRASSAGGLASRRSTMYRVTVAASGRRRPPPVESWTPQRESGREHHIVDEAGDEIGRAIELPKLRRWKQVPGIHRGDVRLAIYDSDGIKLLELVRPPGLLRGAAVTDGNGARIGWIAKRKRRRFEFENVLGQRIGTMTRKARRY